MELLYITILPGLPNLVVLGLEVVDDVTDIIFHVTWQDHAIKGPLDLMEGHSSLYIPIL